MNEVLQEAVTGESAVLVTLGEKEYPLAFPLHACALYQRETAKLDRARRTERGALKPAETHALKEQRSELLRQADAAQTEIEDLPASAQAEKLERFYELLNDAMAIKNLLDEDSARGDSLFLEANWFKVTTDDPDRVVLALWAGLHQTEEFPGRMEPKWVAPFTLLQLRKLVDPSNAEEMIDAIGKALRVYAVKKKQRRLAASGALLTMKAPPSTENPSPSPDSGPSPELTSDSPNPSS